MIRTSSMSRYFSRLKNIFLRQGRKIFQVLPCSASPCPSPEGDEMGDALSLSLPFWGSWRGLLYKENASLFPWEGSNAFPKLYLPVGFTNELFLVHTFQISCKVTTYFRDYKRKRKEVCEKGTKDFTSNPINSPTLQFLYSHNKYFNSNLHRLLLVFSKQN